MCDGVGPATARRSQVRWPARPAPRGLSTASHRPPPRRRGRGRPAPGFAGPLVYDPERRGVAAPYRRAPTISARARRLDGRRASPRRPATEGERWGRKPQPQYYSRETIAPQGGGEEALPCEDFARRSQRELSPGTARLASVVLCLLRPNAFECKSSPQIRDLLDSAVGDNVHGLRAPAPVADQR